MKSSDHAIRMIMTYWRETDRQEAEHRAHKIIDPALNNCLAVKIDQQDWDMLVTMLYGCNQSYTINEKNELIKGINAGEKMIPESLPLKLSKKGNTWERELLK